MPRIRRRLATWTLLGLLSALAARGAASSDPGKDDLAVTSAVSRTMARAVAKARSAVVTIRAFGTGSDGYGAGVIIRADGRVLTALHVIEGATTLIIGTDDGNDYPGNVVGTDSGTDLALVEILAPGKRFPVARFGREERLDVGDLLLVVSNPFGVGTTATRGILSARDRRNVVPGIEVPLLQTDAVINPGSSGGALLDMRGDLIGIITAILTRTGGHQGIGFAVPAAEVRRVLPHLHSGKSVPRPWIGVRVAPVDGGLKVKRVDPKGPAAKSGLRVGDVLVELGGEPIRTTEDLKSALRMTEIGAGRKLSIRRGRGGLVLTIRVESRS